MTNPLRENLIGYLLGALSDEETADIERQLADSAELREELEILRLSLEPLQADRDHHVPPEGLADLTCEVVAEYESDRRFFRRVYDHGGYHGRGWSMADMVVAAGIILAISLLFLPALAASRYQSRILACQNNLRTISNSLHEYTDHGSGYFPRVPTRGNRSFAGIYGPILYRAKLLDKPRTLICPSSDLAKKRVFQLPTLEDIDFTSSIALAEIRRYSGGSYGYTLGVVVDGVHQAPKNQGRSTFVLMADAPSLHLKDRQSANHGAYGQNFLYEDGHIRFIKGSPKEVCVGDNPLVSARDHGFVEAGINPDDAVIGQSSSVPLLKTTFATPPATRR